MHYVKGDKLLNTKTGKVVTFIEYYVFDLFKYKLGKQEHIGNHSNGRFIPYI